jgi:hypothetical protein
MFDQAKACEEIAAGKSLREVGQLVGVTHSTICKTAQRDPEFGNQYARAMEIRAELDVNEIPVLRERMLRGEITPEQCRVAIDSIKWPASKRLPKLYGDRVQVDADMRLQVTVDDPTQRATATLARPALPHDAD